MFLCRIFIYLYIFLVSEIFLDSYKKKTIISKHFGYDTFFLFFFVIHVLSMRNYIKCFIWHCSIPYEILPVSPQGGPKQIIILRFIHWFKLLVPRLPKKRRGVEFFYLDIFLWSCSFSTSFPTYVIVLSSLSLSSCLFYHLL